MAEPNGGGAPDRSASGARGRPRHGPLMCGIAGLLDPDRRFDPAELGRRAEAMAATVTHRGPDASGLWCEPEGGVALGHRRLAVVGLGAGGDQPMVSADGRYVLSYNGELYNHRSLRSRLSAEGVVLPGRVRHRGARRGGGPCGARRRARRHRGHVRLRPVGQVAGACSTWFVTVSGRSPSTTAGSVAVWPTAPSSRPCARSTSSTVEVDRDAVALFLRHNCVPAPWTIYRGVAKLCPGQHPDRRPRDPARRRPRPGYLLVGP